MFNSVACLKRPSRSLTSFISKGRTLKETISGPLVFILEFFFEQEIIVAINIIAINSGLARFFILGNYFLKIQSFHLGFSLKCSFNDFFALSSESNDSIPTRNNFPVFPKRKPSIPFSFNEAI